MGTYQLCFYVYYQHSGVAGRSLSVQYEGQWFESRMTLYICVCQFHFLLVGAMYCYECKICTMIIEVV